MTPKERKEVIRIYGKDFEEIDIPTYIRQRDFEREQELANLTEENQ